MALTDSENPSNAQRPVPVPPSASRSHIPHDYLARLPALHDEAAENLRLIGFVGHSAHAACLLMLGGAVTLLLGGGTLAGNFAWSVLVLAGVVAMTVPYIRGPARAPFRRIRPQDAAADLRAALLYTGFAWGAGAFIALPSGNGAVLAVAFALIPSVLLALVLRDEMGIANFTAPACILAAMACLLRHGPGGTIAAALILTAGLAVIATAWAQGRARPEMKLPHAA